MPNYDNPTVQEYIFECNEFQYLSLKTSSFPKMRLTNFKLLIFIFTLLLSARTIAQINSEFEKRIDEIFKMSTNTTPGASVAILKNGKLIFNKGYGIANMDFQIPIDTNTLFDIASLTKHFTAYSILLLEQQGKLKLNDEVSKYIADFPFKNKHITIEHLLYHTSGIKDYINLQKVVGSSLYDPYSNPVILNQIKKQETLNFEPGSSIIYSNSNYLLLAEIVKKTSGMTLDKFCLQFIFQPLQMNNTVFLFNNSIRNRATSYFKNENKYESWVNASNVMGPMGAYSTSADICKWLYNLSTGAVGGKQLSNKFVASSLLNEGTYIHTQSCVLAKKVFHNQNLYFSNGNMSGYKSQVFYFPDQQIAIVVLSNSGDDINVYGAASKIADLLLENEPANHPKLNVLSKKAFSVRNLKRYEGDYDLSNGFKVSVKEINRKLHIKSVWDNDYLEMHTIDSNAFLVDHDDYRNREIKFVNDPTSKQYILVYNHIERGYRYEYTNPTKSYLTQFVGKYYSKELETIYTVTLKDTTLFASHFINGELALKPMNGNVFEGGEWWFDKIQFIKNEKNTITGFNLKLDRIKHLEFTKLESLNSE